MNQAVIQGEETHRTMVGPRHTLVTPPTRLTIETVSKKDVRILDALRETRGRAPMTLSDVRGVIKERFWKDYPEQLGCNPLGSRVAEMEAMGYVNRFGNGLAITQAGDSLYFEVKTKKPAMLAPSSTPNVLARR